MSGWFAVKRGALFHDLLKPQGKYSRFEAWIWLLENACYEPTEIEIGGRPYMVPRGSCCFSMRFIAQKWRWSRTAVETFLGQLEKVGTVEVTEPRTGPSRSQRRSQVTICNYDKYQFDRAKEEAKNRAKNRAEEEQDNNITLDSSLRSESKGADAPIEFSIITKMVWEAGKQYLSQHNVKNEGGLIGRWLKTYKPIEILNAIEAAQKSGTQDPVPYITQALKPSTQPTATEIMKRINLEGLQ